MGVNMRNKIRKETNHLSALLSQVKENKQEWKKKKETFIFNQDFQNLRNSTLPQKLCVMLKVPVGKYPSKI